MALRGFIIFDSSQMTKRFIFVTDEMMRMVFFPYYLSLLSLSNTTFRRLQVPIIFEQWLIYRFVRIVSTVDVLSGQFGCDIRGFAGFTGKRSQMRSGAVWAETFQGV